MWITELRTNTMTADNRIGAHSDSEVRCSIGTPWVLLGVPATPPWASRGLYAETPFRPKAQATLLSHRGLYPGSRRPERGGRNLPNGRFPGGAPGAQALVCQGSGGRTRMEPSGHLAL